MKSVRIRIFSVRIFPHLDRNWRDTTYLSVFSPNVGKYGPEKLRMKWVEITYIIRSLERNVKSSKNVTLHKKISFPLRISLVDKKKSPVSYRFF